MIQIKLEDTIIDIIQKIESQELWDIILSIPVWHPVLYNYISLKILKNKVWNKRRCVIVCSDRLAKKIGQSIGIEYSLIKRTDFIKSQNTEDLMHHNFTWKEYIWYEIKHYKDEIKTYFKNNKKAHIFKNSHRQLQEYIPLNALFIILFLSTVLFIFIYYTVVNKSFIYIKPEFKVQKQIHNFVLSEKKSNSLLWSTNSIELKKIQEIFTLEQVFQANDIEFKSANLSHWMVKIYNKTWEPISLKPKTRLQTQDGIIYEIWDWVKIPAGIIDNFWSIEAWSKDIQVQAKSVDNEWNIIGSRGNKKMWESLIFPWLTQEMQTEVYAEIIEDMTWWNEAYTKRVSEIDISNAKKFLEDKLKQEALKKLKKTWISDIDVTPWYSPEIVTLPGTIIYSPVQFTLRDSVKPGDIRNDFSLIWTIEITGYTYNKETVMQTLRNIIQEKKLDKQEIIEQIDENSLRTSEILYKNTNPFEIKTSFEIEYIVKQDFWSQDNIYVNGLTEKIRGIDVSEAEKILLNDPQISSVRIKNRPFFSKNITRVWKNIYFEVE